MRYLQNVFVEQVLFYISIGFMFLMSMTFLFMPFASKQMLAGNLMGVRIVGGVFWGTLIVAYALLIRCNHIRKFHVKDNRQGQMTQVRRWGILHIASNKIALIFDVITVISLVALIATVLSQFSNHYIVYVFLFILYFSFQMHCVLNGNIYLYIQNIEQRGKRQ